MQTVELKLIVEALAKNADNFASQYEVFKKDASRDLQDEYDKFMCGICDCYEALSIVIGTAEVENIKNRR